MVGVEIRRGLGPAPMSLRRRTSAAREANSFNADASVPRSTAPRPSLYWAMVLKRSLSKPYETRNESRCSQGGGVPNILAAGKSW